MIFPISFQFPDEKIDLEIGIIDHPAVEDWSRHFANDGRVYQANLQDWQHVRPWQPAIMQQMIDKINQALRNLESHGMSFAGPVPKHSRDLSREFTNRCHRFFTQNQQQVNQSDRSRDEILQLSHWLSEINQSIHDLESYLPPARDTGYKTFEEIHIEFDSTCNQWQDPNWWQMHDSWRALHTTADQHFDVILTSEILGKTLLRSYLDDDDPHHWDTSGHYDSLGGLQIQFGPYRKTVYESQDFHDWLGPTLNTCYFDFPIGNVIDRDLLYHVGQKLDQIRSSCLSVPVYYGSLRSH